MTAPLRVVYDGPVMAGRRTTLTFIGRRLGAKWESSQGLEGARIREATVTHDGVTVRLAGYASMAWTPGDWGRLYDGADVIVFVADSQSPRVEASEERIDMIAASFARMKRELPVVFQFNKRDIDPRGWTEWSHEGGSRPIDATVLSIEELSRRLNRWNGPCFPSVATRGEGVWEAFTEAVRLGTVT